METTYFDMPTNFVSRKSSKVNAHAQQNNPQFHNFSVPLLQIPLFEKKKLEKAAAKKMEEQKVLKQKLKTLGHISPQNEKFPLTYKLFQTQDNKLEDIVFGTSYGNSIKTPQEIKIKGFSKPTLNPFLHEDDVIEGVSTPRHWATKHINFDTVYSKSANHSPRHFMIKQKFTNNKTMNRPPDADLRTQLITATQACIENNKKDIKPMKTLISSTPNFLSKSGINSLRSFMLSKTPEIKNFRDVSENEKGSEGSPVKRIIKSHRSYFKSHGMKRVDDHNHLKQLEGNFPFERVKDPEELVFNITSENIENRPKGIFLKKLSITQFSPLPEEVDDAPEKFPSPIPSSFRLEKQNDLSMSSITNPVLKGSRLHSLAKVFSEAIKPSPLLKEKQALGLKVIFLLVFNHDE